jgi:hypothetical protein
MREKSTEESTKKTRARNLRLTQGAWQASQRVHRDHWMRAQALPKILISSIAAEMPQILEIRP